MMDDVEVLKSFRPLWQNDATNYREFIFYGGRFGGKNHAISDFVCCQALEKKTRVLVLREFATAGRGSVYTDIKDFFDNHAIETIISSIDLRFNKNNFFIKYKADRISLANGSEFIFAGINDNVVDSLKGLKDINICWLDEANFLTQYSYAKLEPTIRADKSFLIFTFNPEKSDEFIYQKAITNKNPRIYVAKVNAVKLVRSEIDSENKRFKADKTEIERVQPFLNDTNFASIKDHLLLYTEQMWRHHYLGEPYDAEDGNIIPVHLFGKFDNHALPRYKETIITADTAFSKNENADYSVLLAAGITAENELHILKVVRERLEFNELYKATTELHGWVQNITGLPPTVIVEKKASGQSLLQELRRTTHLPIREVVPKKDKYTRVSSIIDEYSRVRLPMYKSDNPLDKEWADEFLRECKAFRADLTHLHDDQVDALYYALDYSKRENSVDWGYLASNL